MSIWLLLALMLAFVAVVALGIVFPVIVALWRNVSAIAHANSPEFRLSMANLWTEIQHIKNGGSIQMMKMEDGNIILLSLGPDTTKVLVTPRLDSIESFTELASFPNRQPLKTHSFGG